MEFKSAMDNVLNQGYPVDDNSFLGLLESKGYHLEELESIVRSSGKRMVLATAGAGKSTAISAVYIKEKLYGKLSGNGALNVGGLEPRAWVTTFLGSGASDLKLNIEKNIGSLELYNLAPSNTSFKTIHAEFLELINVFYAYIKGSGATPDFTGILDSGSGEMNEVENRIYKGIFKMYNLNGYSNGYLDMQSKLSLRSIISRYRNTSISKYEFGDAQDEADRLGLNLSMLPLIVSTYANYKNINKVIDFDDMVQIIKEFTKDPVLCELYVNRYSYIFLDEAQDMSELQYEALKPLFDRCPNIMLVGDPDQSIYSFRGANSHVMSWFDADFKPTIYPLSVSYRCPSNIMNPMAISISCNEDRYESTPRSFKEGGICKAYSFTTLKQMVDATIDLIDSKLAESKTVTVLSRVNFTYSPVSIAYAIKRGVNFNLLGKVQDLNTSVYRKVWQLIELVRGRGLENLQANLITLSPNLKPWDVKHVVSYMMNAVPKDGNVLSYIESIALDLESKPLLALADKVASYFDDRSAHGLDADPMYVFNMLLTHLDFYGRPEIAEASDAIKSLAFESETVEDFFTNMDFVNNAIKGAKYNSGTAPLTFATPFGFKGKESDVVINFNASDSVYPYKLSTSLNYPEERRVFFVAGTRAKVESYFLTKRGKESPYLVESKLEIVPYTGFGKGISITPVAGGGSSRSLKERMSEELNSSGASKLDEPIIDLSSWGL